MYCELKFDRQKPAFVWEKPYPPTGVSAPWAGTESLT
jgi:hypothetical protein